MEMDTMQNLPLNMKSVHEVEQNFIKVMKEEKYFIFKIQNG
jgi:hypothetical protein